MHVHMHTSGRKSEHSLQECSLLYHVGGGDRTQTSGLWQGLYWLSPFPGLNSYVRAGTRLSTQTSKATGKVFVLKKLTFKKQKGQDLRLRMQRFKDAQQKANGGDFISFWVR